jgi:hypothetical protein
MEGDGSFEADLTECLVVSLYFDSFLLIALGSYFSYSINSLACFMVY